MNDIASSFDPRAFINHSRRVRAESFRTDWMREAASQLNLSLSPPHRKVWEFGIIMRAFRSRAEQQPYTAVSCPRGEESYDSAVAGVRYVPRRPRVLGFGVGREPLPAWFVSRGADVLATDKPAIDTLPGWRETGQHAAEHSQLGRLWYVNEDEMTEYCNYASVDMANLPTSLLREQFDFIYSAGSFEHIGGAHAGLDFFMQSMAALRPGGVAVHTTEYEYEYAPDLPPLDTPDLSLYRDADISALSVSLVAQGDLLLPLDAVQGTEPEDLYTDRPPYAPDALSHLNIELAGGRRTTSIALIAIRGGGGSAGR